MGASVGKGAAPECSAASGAAPTGEELRLAQRPPVPVGPGTDPADAVLPPGAHQNDRDRFSRSGGLYLR